MVWDRRFQSFYEEEKLKKQHDDVTKDITALPKEPLPNGLVELPTLVINEAPKTSRKPPFGRKKKPEPIVTEQTQHETTQTEVLEKPVVGGLVLSDISSYDPNLRIDPVLDHDVEKIKNE